MSGLELMAGASLTRSRRRCSGRRCSCSTDPIAVGARDRDEDERDQTEGPQVEGALRLAHALADETGCSWNLQPGSNAAWGQVEVFINGAFAGSNGLTFAASQAGTSRSVEAA
jgi:hypothetical protein